MKINIMHKHKKCPPYAQQLKYRNRFTDTSKESGILNRNEEIKTLRTKNCKMIIKKIIERDGTI
jgi:hypothetical protein